MIKMFTQRQLRFLSHIIRDGLKKLMLEGKTDKDKKKKKKRTRPGQLRDSSW